MNEPSTPQRQSVSARKALLFSVVPLGALIVLLALAEGALRLFGDPAPYHLVLNADYDGRPWLQVNRGYLEKYFPANSALIPELKPTLVEQPKPEGALRVLCLGESSMFGTPYHAGAGIPSILQKQLRRICPDRTVEVVNLGASAINSNVIRDFAPQTLALEPDIVLIYTGHNEFYGPDGVGASWLEQRFPALTRWKYAFRDLRLVRLFQHWLRSLWLSHHADNPENLMLQVSEGNRVRSGSREADRVVDNVRENLRGIIALYQGHHVPVIVSDVSSNLRFPPFIADSLASTSEVSGLLLAGRTDEALHLLSGAHEADSSNARTEFWLGQLWIARGDTVRARREFERARDEDLLKFRAPSSINAAIRDVCREMGTPFVSSDSALSAASPGGITDPSLFWEHLHLRLSGYYIIADQFLRAMLAEGLVKGADPGRAMAGRIPCDPDSLSVSWLDQALADLSIDGLTQRWPFNAYRPAPVVFNGADTALQRIALEVYGRRLGWNEGCLQTAQWFLAHGRTGEARTTCEAILEEYPRAYAVRYMLANILKDQGDLGQAREQYRKIVATNPSYPFAHVELGLLLINEGEFEQARKELKTGLSQAATAGAPLTLQATALYGLAAVAANERSYDEAMVLVDASLQFSPGYRPAIDLRRQIVISRKYLPQKH